jgi:hypothetical protein
MIRIIRPAEADDSTAVGKADGCGELRDCFRMGVGGRRDSASFIRGITQVGRRRATEQRRCTELKLESDKARVLDTGFAGQTKEFTRLTLYTVATALFLIAS